MADKDREPAVRRIGELCQRLGEIPADGLSVRGVARSSRSFAQRQELPEHGGELGAIDRGLVKDYREDSRPARGTPVTINNLLDVVVPWSGAPLHAVRETGAEHGD